MSDQPRALLVRSVRSLVVMVVVLVVAVFLPAGDLWWTKGWLFLLVFLVWMVLGVVYLWRTNPDIFVARSGIHKGTKAWDKVLLMFIFPSILAVFPVAGLDDGRFHWSSVPLWLVVLGYVGLSTGFLLTVWVEKVNKYAEPGVRIQAEQKVVDTGPYAVVRHPMYGSGILMFAGIPLALGSYWALIPAALAILILVPRTVMEDRTLQEDLAGYREYAGRVRFRLIPGIW